MISPIGGCTRRQPSGRTRAARIRDQLRLPLPLRPQRARIRDPRAARGPRLGRPVRPLLARPESRRGRRRPRVGSRPGERGGGVLALEWGLAVRDAFPEKFLDWHLAAFAARHDHAQKLADEAVLRERRNPSGSIPTRSRPRWRPAGRSRPSRQSTPTRSRRNGMFGVPTFVVGDQAVFVRLMDRNNTEDIDPRPRPLRLPGPERVQAHPRPPVARSHLLIGRLQLRLVPPSGRSGRHAGRVRMTDAESIMWAVERDPALRSDFCNLTILDHRPDDERLRITLGARARCDPTAAPTSRPRAVADTSARARRRTRPRRRCARRARQTSARRHADVARGVGDGGTGAARSHAAAVAVHGVRGPRRRPRRDPPEDPSHDHRRRRRLAPLARVRRP